MDKALVNSLPKSGTNLLAKCLLLFGYSERGHLSAGSVLDLDYRSRIRNIVWISDRGPYRLGLHNPVRVKAWPIDQKLRSLRDSQFISSHLGYDDRLLRKALLYEIKPIQVLRDPRAVLASFVPYVLNDSNHFLNETFSRMSHGQRLHAALYGLVEQGIKLNPMKDYCLALDTWVDDPNVLKIMFEDIVGEQGGGSRAKLEASLEKLAKWLNIPFERIDEVADNLYGPGRHTFRKGQIDSWRDDLPPEFISKMNEELKPILETWGYI